MFYSTEEASRYLKMTVSGVKYHVYKTGRLKPEIKGGALVFTKDQLDQFKAIKTRRGRKPKDK